MNVNKAITTDYAKWTLGQAGQNEPNTNPIRTQLKPIQSQNEPNQSQFQRQKNAALEAEKGG